MEGRRIRLTIEYDGTGYCGFQDQGREDRPSIQATLEFAWEKLTGERLRVVGAGRTDAGVHALGQVVHLDSNTRIPVDRIPFALNTHLPRDIVVLRAEVVEPTFHARFSASSKVYRYLWFNRPIRSPLFEHRAQWVPEPLRIEAMQEAARLFIGTHDFAAFRSAKGSAKSSVRRILDASVTSDCQPIIQFTVEGDGFLYNMVRIMAGTLLEVGLGRTEPEDVARALQSGVREHAGPTAPPHGLYLVAVRY